MVNHLEIASSPDFNDGLMNTPTTSKSEITGSNVHTPPPKLNHQTLSGETIEDSLCTQIQFNRDEYLLQKDSDETKTEWSGVKKRTAKKLRPSKYSVAQLVLLKAPGKPWWPGTIIERLSSPENNYFVAHLGVPEFVVAGEKEIKNFPSELPNYSKPHHQKVFTRHKGLKQSVISAIRLTLRLKLPLALNDSLATNQLFRLARSPEFRGLGKVILTEAVYIREMHNIHIVKSSSKLEVQDSNQIPQPTVPRTRKRRRSGSKRIQWNVPAFYCRSCFEFFDEEHELVDHLRDELLSDWHSRSPWIDADCMSSDEVEAEMKMLGSPAASGCV